MTRPDPGLTCFVVLTATLSAASSLAASPGECKPFPSTFRGGQLQDQMLHLQFVGPAKRSAVPARLPIQARSANRH